MKKQNQLLLFDQLNQTIGLNKKEQHNNKKRIGTTRIKQGYKHDRNIYNKWMEWRLI